MKKKSDITDTINFLSAPLIFASFRELTRKIGVLRHTHGGEAMLALMMKIVLLSYDIVFSFPIITFCYTVA